jgi:hypothetical protein
MWTNDGPALYFNADKSKVVKEGDTAAAFLFVAAGGQIPLSEAERWGLTKSGQAKETKAEPDEAEGGLKIRKEAPDNKLKSEPPNKSKG